MIQCPYCGAVISNSVYHSSECPSCKRPLHSCRCCTFYSPESHYGYRESVDEPVWDKEKSNFCDYFCMGSAVKPVKTSSTEPEDKAKKSREALDKLFNF